MELIVETSRRFDIYPAPYYAEELGDMLHSVQVVY